MSKIFRYTVNVFIPDYIQKEQLARIIQFDEVKSNYKIAYKNVESSNFDMPDPETANSKMIEERTAVVEIILKANSIEEALYNSKNVLEDRLAIISFLSLYPCKILNEGSVECIEPGQEEVELLSESFDISHIFNPYTIKDIQLLYNQPDEKVLSSLRWFRKGLLENNLFDKFISLWIAFEMISSKLKPSEPKYLRCPKHGHEIRNCPICGVSTESKPMEKDGIIHHIHNNLKIEEKAYYSKLNNMRNDIFHGRSKKVKQNKLKIELEKLKYCLVTAYSFLIYGEIPNENSLLMKRFKFLAQEIDVNIKLNLKKEAVDELEKKRNKGIRFFELKY
jgi:hypothetical protein